MPRGRPRSTGEKEMPVKHENVKAVALDEIDKKSDCCPWCNYENLDEEKGKVHARAGQTIDEEGELDGKVVSYFVRNIGHAWQCDFCGKTWQKVDLGKDWSLGLERGIAWVKSMQARNLQEGRAVDFMPSA